MLRTSSLLTLGAVVVATASVGSCGKPAATQQQQQQQLTYYHDVQPIMAANCVGCHNPTGIGPFDLTTYDAVKTNGALVAPEVTAGLMPPWMPGPDTPAMVDQRGLTSSEIQTINDWVNQGMVEGTPTQAQSTTTPTTTFQASATLQVPMPYTPNASLGTDDYHCFVLDPQLTEDTAVSAFNILPGDRRVVHHVILYEVDTSDQAQLQQLEAGGDGNGYTCFGGSGIDSSPIVGGWVPGTTATTFPAGTAPIIKAGAMIVMQVHYNLLVVQHTTDQTSAALEYVPASSVNEGYFIPIDNTTFSIPPGQVQTVTQTIDSDSLQIPAGVSLTIWGVLPHMHLHGTQINVTGQNGTTGSTYEFVDIPKWQFQWQQLYFFKQPITFQKGDSATIACTFDNTQANQPVINGVQETPQTLTWGEDTLQEMCLNFFYVTVNL